MQSQVPSQSFVWGVLAARFDSELTLQKSEIWRLSGLLEEYGGAADGDFYREREQKALIDELTGLLVQAVTKEAASRQFTNNSSRRAGRPDHQAPDAGQDHETDARPARTEADRPLRYKESSGAGPD